MKRVVVPELLDDDAGTAAEIGASLQDLRKINRLFGGTRVTRKVLEEIVARFELHSLSYLDIGGADGNVCLEVQKYLAAKGIDFQPVILDRSDKHLTRNLASVCADALLIPFAEDSFDAVGCSLLAHHLEPQEIIRFVNEALRVARYAVMINDLRRSKIHLALVYAGFPLFRSRLTRHDAPASVRRSYTCEEMAGLLGQSQAAKVDIKPHYLHRMAAVAWKRQGRRLGKSL